MPHSPHSPLKSGDGFRNPHNLPTRTCAACGKPFTWRKKWERDWANVRYCSDACRRTKGTDSPADL